MTRRIIAVLLCLVATAPAADYYVSPTGNDSQAGTSPATAWKTPAKVTSFAGSTGFAPGDRIRFQGGGIFTGRVYLAGPAANAGTTNQPITLTTYGTGRATLFSTLTNQSVLYAYNAGGLVLDGLDARGPGSDSTSGGFEFYSDSGALATNIPAITITNCTAAGFKTGILIGAWDGEFGYHGIRIVNTQAFSNWGAGFFVYGVRKTSHQNLVIRDCTAYHNPGKPGHTGNSGNGILINGVTTGLVEYCTARDNGGLGNGNVGIWTYGVDSVTIQFCESYNHRTAGSADGGGFDFDGGTVNSRLQFNYSRNNDGAGYLFAQYANATAEYGPLKNNIVRYNISENDGRKNNYGGLLFWGANATDHVSTNDIYHNTIYMGGTPSNGAPSCVRLLGANFRGLRLRNNLFVAANGHRLINADNAAATNLVWHHGNNWWSAPGTQFQIKWGATIYSNLPAWRVATHQERLPGGPDTGYDLDPRLTNPGAGSAAGYTLLPESPLIDAAQVLLSDPGSHDYFGNPIPQGATFDIGAHDMRPTVRIATTAGPASEFGPVTGAFTLTRTGGTVTNLVVTLTASGTASAGADYVMLPGTVSIPLGASNTVVTVVPIPDDWAEGDESVTGQVVASSLYLLGVAAATLTIQDLPADAWRFAYFGGNPPGSGDAEDADADGLPNLLEYALGRHPWVADGPATATDTSDGYLTLVYSRPEPAPVDLHYEVGAAGDLSNWCWAASCTTTQVQVAGGVATVRARDTVPVSESAQRFLRLRVRR